MTLWHLVWARPWTPGLIFGAITLLGVWAERARAGRRPRGRLPGRWPGGGGGPRAGDPPCPPLLVSIPVSGFLSYPR